MERGFIKLWNKLKDSRSYSRGGVHRAVLLTIFAEATRRTSFFKGVELKPGQMAVSVMGLAEDLGFPRTTVQRALSDLATDGVVTVENMGNRWTRITLINWGVYQVDLENVGQPTGNQWATDGQPVGTLKDIKNINTFTSVSNDTSVNVAQTGRKKASEGDVLVGKRKRLEGKRKQSFEEFWEAFGYKKGKAEAIDAWAAIPTLTDALVEQILAAARREAERRPETMAAGRTPIYAQGWISGRRWEDEELSEAPRRRPEYLTNPNFGR